MAQNNQSASNTAFSELEQLRLIIFGEAQRELNEQIQSLSELLNKQFNELRAEQQKSNQELKSLLEQASEQLSDKVDYVDRHHEGNHEKMVATTETLNAQIDMNEASGKDDSQALHNKIDAEIAKLSTTFSEKHAQAMAALEKVTHELTDSKTDRKTLAKLLATMASNLESD
jgi:predicted glycoside hydrolase/deacetylase ChbG (UPF0249 family)